MSCLNKKGEKKCFFLFEYQIFFVYLYLEAVRKWKK